MHRFRVKTDRGSYPVVVGRGAWQDLQKLLPRYSSVFVLTEKAIWNRWGEAFQDETGLSTFAAKVLFIPGGEKSKSMAEAERTAGMLLTLGADRRSLLVLLGGGVVGDLGGFVASTYMRGIDCVQAPTTLVGQVDSAVGGKTAVNLGAMKNLVGTFSPPRLVLADPVVMSSLSVRIFRSGLYEVVKHAILAGPEAFGRLERDLEGLEPGDAAKIEGIVARSVKVKIDVVNRDERERSLRHVLNLGHTFGHALEEATNYRRFLHGEAVGWGLLAITLIAEHLGYMKAGTSGPRSRARGSAASVAERIRGLVRRIGPLPSIRDVEPTKIRRLLPQDKKTIGGEIHWVIPESIGKVRIVKGISLDEAESVWNELRLSDEP
ncbi:MAG TPA: 3-dehydroquinate synthase [Terriglobia bacterium]|nr:3-dehydroquinate synthase [Terriglobia bacterium]